MSKDTPEVGDVWEHNGTLIYIEQIGEKYNKEFVYCFIKLKNSVRAYGHIYTKTYIKRTIKYLGKSKTNIDDLFKTENEEWPGKIFYHT